MICLGSPEAGRPRPARAGGGRHRLEEGAERAGQGAEVKCRDVWLMVWGDSLLLSNDRAVTMALIALSAELTAAKVCDIERKSGMFGVMTACRRCKMFPFSFHI